MYCGEQTAVKYQGATRTAVSLRCRSWGCEDCAEVRKRQLIAEICAGAPTTFLTLTIRRSEAKTPADAARMLSHAFRKLRERLMYWHKWKKLPFMCVFEPHKSGWPHLHIFLRAGFIAQQEISGWMSWLINSPIIDIRRLVNKGQAAAYAAKYVTKQSVKFGTSKRYWQSVDYDLRTDRSVLERSVLGGGWEVERVNLKRWCGWMRELGWQVELQSTCKAVAKRPP